MSKDWSAKTTGRPGFRTQQRTAARRGSTRPPFADRANSNDWYPPNWDEISLAIRKRDGYRCRVDKLFPERKCSMYLPPPFHRYLHVHHLEPLPHGSNEPRNLLSLCAECHGFCHGRYLGKISDRVKAVSKR